MFSVFLDFSCVGPFAPEPDLLDGQRSRGAAFFWRGRKNQSGKRWAAGNGIIRDREVCMSRDSENVGTLGTDFFPALEKN
jgi:hypothetical protein